MGAAPAHTHSGAGAPGPPTRVGVRPPLDRGAVVLFTGNAMELLGGSIPGEDGRLPALGFAGFLTEGEDRRDPGDVIAHTALWDSPVVGFMNKCSRTFMADDGDDTPLFDRLSLGMGNQREKGPEGYVKGNVFATHLTGPVLVKNPDFVDFLIRRLYEVKGWELPEALPVLPYEREAYEVTLKELTARAGN